MTASNMKKPFSLLPLLIVIGIIAFGLYWFQSDMRKAEVVEAPTQGETSGFSKALATGPLAALLVHEQRKDIASFSFANSKGGILDLSKWKGRVVLLNLWATWCAPCRKEMPDLAKLQSELGGADFEVVALSVDRKGLAASEAFLKEIGVTKPNRWRPYRPWGFRPPS
jgi:thiol-disulfide isomerase/thioredoxin